MVFSYFWILTPATAGNCKSGILIFPEWSFSGLKDAKPSFIRRHFVSDYRMEKPPYPGRYLSILEVAGKCWHSAAGWIWMSAVNSTQNIPQNQWPFALNNLFIRMAMVSLLPFYSRRLGILGAANHRQHELQIESHGTITSLISIIFLPLLNSIPMPWLPCTLMLRSQQENRYSGTLTYTFKRNTN